MTSRFQIQQVGGSLTPVDCPEPNDAHWDWTEQLQVSLTGRGVQQGRLKVTLSWELMSDGDFGNLMDQWRSARSHGYRLSSIAVPTFKGDDNGTYPTFTGAGNPGGYIRMMMPLGNRLVYYVKDVTVVFEDVVENG